MQWLNDDELVFLLQSGSSVSLLEFNDGGIDVVYNYVPGSFLQIDASNIEIGGALLSLEGVDLAKILLRTF